MTDPVIVRELARRTGRSEAEVIAKLARNRRIRFIAWLASQFNRTMSPPRRWE